MPWIDASDHYAAPPVVHEPTPTTDLGGVVEAERGEHRFDDVTVDGDRLELGPHVALTLESSVVRNLLLCLDDEVELDASWCSFAYCDLSRVDVRRLRSSRFTDCKLVGTDFSDAEVVDVVFERCVLSLANLRMARFTRVRFEDCTLTEVDAFELTATDVTFDGSGLDRVNVDRWRTERVDLRGARSVQLENVGRLDGVLVADHQVASLMYTMAFALGLGIERPD